MALFFHSDDVDQMIPFKEAVQITENALRDMISSEGVCAPRKRLNLHRNVAEGSFDTVLNIYAGGAASYGAIGAQVALHRKAIAGRTQKRPAFNPDQTELAVIYDSDTGSLLGVMAHRPRSQTCARRPRVWRGSTSLRARMPSVSAFMVRASRLGQPSLDSAKCGRSRALKSTVRRRLIARGSLKKSWRGLVCR